MKVPHEEGSARVNKKQAARTVGRLAADGFLHRCRNIHGRPMKPCGFPGVVLEAGGPDKTTLREEVGWGLPMLGRLDALRRVLDGEAAEAMDKFLAGLEER